MRRLLLVSIFSFACSIPSPESVPLRCDPDNPCPEGRTCQAGMCSVPLDDHDLGTSSGMDSGLPDASEVSGCKAANGRRLGANQWACSGAFGDSGKPKASELCATGFTVCPQLDSAALAACNSMAGFWASPIIGSRRDTATPGTGQCDQREIMAVVYGCGMSGLAASMACNGYSRLIDCNSQLGVWICGTTIDATTSRNASNGVLCCK